MPTTTHRLGLATLLVAAMVATAPITGVMAAAVQQEGVTVEQTPESTTVQPGESVTIEIAFDAAGLLIPSMEFKIPEGWDVTDHSVTGIAKYREATDRIVWADREGAEHTIMITVQVPSDAEPGDHTVSATGIAGHGESQQEATGATMITVDAEEPTPTETDTGADGATDTPTDTPEEPTPTDAPTPTDTPEEPTPTDAPTPTDTPEEPADSDEDVGADDSADDEVDDRDGEKSKDDDADDEGC